MKRIPLNFDWQFVEGMMEKSKDQIIEGTIVHLPHTIREVNEQYFDEKITQRTATYQKQFDYQLDKDKRLFLECEGIMSKAKVYINGEILGEHIGGYTAFQYELTPYIVETSNLLTIEVDSHESGDHPPFGGVVDYLTYGGIYREVCLIETNQVAVEYMLIDGDQTSLNIQIKLDDKLDMTHRLKVLIERDGKTTQEYSMETKEQSIKWNESHTLEQWSIDRPIRYKASLFVDDLLAYETMFGVRCISVTKDGFYLNNQKIFLRGLNRHQSYPYVGYAMPKSAQEKDADILKFDLGSNIVRSSHYPPSKHFLNRCDEIGLLVFTEMPGWQHIGDDSWKEHALKNLEDLMIQGYNHPSIVIVGTRINETIDDDAFYEKTREIAKRIDTSRPTGGVRYFAFSNLKEDIYTVNDFVHRGNNRGLTPKKKMTHKNHPYLVTEYNGHMFPTKSFDDEAKRIEHTKRHFNVLNDGYNMEGLMGVIGWCMNDYHTHKDFGSNNHICHHGVLDINRNSKYAASAYASQEEQPFMEVLSMMHIGDLPGGELKEVLVATNCEYVKLYKNEEYIGTYYREPKIYPHLLHPPIVIRDFIGNQIETYEKFSKKDANRIKRVLLDTLKNDLKMSISSKIMMGYILMKYKLDYQDAVNLYLKYIAGWGEKTKQYRFEGYVKDVCVKTLYKGNNDDYQLWISKDRDSMEINDTYDVMRVTVELANEWMERAFYTHEVIEIHVTGNLELIGPNMRSLSGGIHSFWLKAVEPGMGEVMIKSQFYSAKKIVIQTN